MPVIYMKHPIHGAKIATMEMEAVYDERNGWERYTLDDEPEPSVSQSVNVLGRRRRKEPEPDHAERI
jgi:hypothetical protein